MQYFFILFVLPWHHRVPNPTVLDGLCGKTAAHGSHREHEGGEGIRGPKEYKAELVGLGTRARTDLHLARATQLPAGITHTRLRKGSGQQCN